MQNHWTNSININHNQFDVSSFCLPTTKTFQRFFLPFFRSQSFLLSFHAINWRMLSRTQFSTHPLCHSVWIFIMSSCRWGSGQKCPFHSFFKKKINMTSIRVDKFDVMEDSTEWKAAYFYLKCWRVQEATKKIKQPRPSYMRYIFTSDRNQTKATESKNMAQFLLFVEYDCAYMIVVKCWAHFVAVWFHWLFPVVV